MPASPAMAHKLKCANGNAGAQCPLPGRRRLVSRGIVMQLLRAAAANPTDPLPVPAAPMRCITIPP